MNIEKAKQLFDKLLEKWADNELEVSQTMCISTNERNEALAMIGEEKEHLRNEFLEAMGERIQKQETGSCFDDTDYVDSNPFIDALDKYLERD